MRDTLLGGSAGKITYYLGIHLSCDRAPLPCTCGDIDQIDEVHIDDITEDLFMDKYAYSNRPVVVRNATLDWKAMGVLDYDWLKSTYLK